MNVQTYLNITVRLIGSGKFSDRIKHSFDYEYPEEYSTYFENQIWKLRTYYRSE